MSRPVVGIAGYRARARWDIWDTDATVIQQSYVAGIAAAGGRALVLPPDDADAEVIGRLDGLLLPSGADLDPGLYGQRRHPSTEEPRKDRDAGELLLLRAALDRDLPVLGVCRGLQLLAVVYGGSLYQHLPDVLGHDEHGPTPGVPAEHEAELAEASLAASVYGRRAVVLSHHHQGVADAGGLLVTGRSADGLAEAAEDPGRSFVLGVQWHPEISADKALFAAFVDACATRNDPSCSSREQER